MKKNKEIKVKTNRMASFKYLTKEGFKNIVEKKAMSATSIFVLFCCMVLIGTALMGIINLQSFIGNVQDQNVIMVFAKEGADDEALKALKANIEKDKNVSACKFISKEDGYEKIKAEMGDSSVIFEGLEENPLPDAFEIHLKNQEGFTKTLKYIEKLDNIEYVRENRQMASQLMTIKKVVSVASLTIIVLLLFVSVVVIENTIGLTIENRRLGISIMKSVGATDWFIRWPFVIEGMILGVISALLSVLSVWGIYELVGKSITKLVSNLGIGGVEPFGKWGLILLAGFIIFGVITGAIGSAISITRYLKEKGEHSDGE